MMRIAICDDSRIDVERLECAFDELHYTDVEYDVYFSAAELLKALREQGESYHVYIFDIEMPETNGLELAKSVREKDTKALFVFLTSYTNYVMEVFDVITFDYIAKPIIVEKLESVLQKAMSYLKLIKQDFVFQFRKNHFCVDCDDILYIEKRGRQAVIHTLSNEYKANMTIEEIWEQLDAGVFCHIHVSFIINLRHVKAIDGDEAVLSNGERLLIARAHKQVFKEKHLQLIKRVV